MNKKCYFCAEAATTTEHVPPKCLFPEKEDSDGIDYRINLITVPSCEEHNTEKSSDDEYFLFVLSCNLNANQVAKNHFASKVLRAIKLKPNYFNRFIVNPNPIWVKEKGVYQNSISFDVDDVRYNKVIHHIIRGLFYKEFERILVTPIIQIVYSSAVEINPIDNIRVTDFYKQVKKIISEVPYKGNNQQVFRYKILSEEENHIFMLEFYELFTVIVVVYENTNA